MRDLLDARSVGCEIRWVQDLLPNCDTSGGELSQSGSKSCKWPARGGGTRAQAPRAGPSPAQGVKGARSKGAGKGAGAKALMRTGVAAGRASDLVDYKALGRVTAEHSPIAQWQSTRLLIAGLLVRVQLGEQNSPASIVFHDWRWVFLMPK